MINYVTIHNRIIERGRCNAKKNCRVRNCGSQSQNAQWNKHLLSEAQRVPWSTLIWAISGWSNFSEDKTWDERAVVVMIMMWIDILPLRRALFMNIITRRRIGVFHSIFPSRRNLWRRKKLWKIRSRRNLWLKGIVQSHYLYVIVESFHRDNIIASFCIYQK